MSDNTSEYRSEDIERDVNADMRGVEIGNDARDDNLMVLVVASFNDEATAAMALQQLKQAGHDRQVQLKEVAILHHGEDGKLKIKESGDPGAGQGALIGGAIGGVLGLLLGPLAIPGAAAGAAIGALTEGVHDTGIDEEQLKMLGRRLHAGTAAIVAMTDPDSYTTVETILKDAGAAVTVDGLDASTIRKVTSASSSTAPSTPSSDRPAASDPAATNE